VGFAVKHLGIATVRGDFREFEGTIEIGDDPAASRVYGTVKAASIDTNQDRRDEHLRSPDFFDAANHPELRFESRAIEPIGGNAIRIVGELEMHGVTREIELDAEVGGFADGVHGEKVLGLEVSAEVSRRDYGMRPEAALGTVNAVIADKVVLELDIAAVKEE
jgi:polyisoprenoid-binding protein YceI